MTKQLSKRCPECLLRHSLNHPHIEQYELQPDVEVGDEGERQRIPSSIGPSSIVGSPEDVLKEAAERKRSKTRKPTATEIKITEEERQKREQENLNLCVQFVRVESAIPVIVTGDVRWREYLLESEADVLELAQAYNRALNAWGLEFTGKYASILALIMVHASIGQKLYQRISSEDATKQSKSDES